MARPLQGAGRTTPTHWGAYKSEKLALRATDYVNGELAVGHWPRKELTPPVVRTVLEAFDEWIATFPGRSQALEARHKKSRAALGYLGTVEDRRIRLYDVQAWVNGLAAKYAPGTVAQYLGPVRQALDHAELERPNPARDPRLRLPSMSSEEHEPPSFRAFLRIGGAIGERHRLPLLFMERHGLRIGELHKLVWGDVDLRGRRLRISRGRTKRGTGGERWIPLPAGWAEHLDRLTPIQGRGPDVRVFADFNPRRSGPP